MRKKIQEMERELELRMSLFRDNELPVEDLWENVGKMIYLERRIDLLEELDQLPKDFFDNAEEEAIWHEYLYKKLEAQTLKDTNFLNSIQINKDYYNKFRDYFELNWYPPFSRVIEAAMELGDWEVWFRQKCHNNNDVFDC